MKQIQFRVFIFLLAGATLHAACRKTDSAYREDSKATETTEEQFFKKYASNDPDIKAMAAFIENKNSKNPFIERVVKKIGLPRWDKAIKRSASRTKGRNASDSSEITYVPFVRESQNYVNASLAIKTNGSDTSFTYLCDWQYRQRPFNPASDTSAEAMALFFMQMDRNVFGHTEFMITDTLLFSDHPTEYGTSLKKIQLLNSPSAAGRNSVVILEVCQVYAICGSVDYCNAHGGCDYMDCVSDPDVCGMFEICWEYIPGGGSGGGGSGGGGGGGGTGGTGGNGGSGGGGGGDDDIPPDCGTASFAGSGSTSDLIPCDPGWMPGGGGSTPPPDEPIDTLLKKYSRAIKDTAVYIYDVLSKPANIEYTFTGVLDNNQITVKHIRTNGDSLVVTPHVMIGREILLFTWHSHVSRSSNLSERGSFSPEDIEMLRNVRCLTQGFVSFADCRNKRYALVITDLSKAKVFFNTTDADAIDTNWVTSNTTGTIQDIDERRVKNVIGSANINGISFYVSNDAPGFQTWTLLN